MTLLIFGRSGQVARELAALAPEAILLGRDQADLTNAQSCRAAIAQYRPSAVINAAAWTAVDRAETEEAEATLVNAHAPGAMAQSCTDLGIPFLHISTDYVFDGSGTRPWAPQDATGPLGAYGRSKLAGEQAVRAAGGQHLILRTSWVFSAHGANFVKTMLRLGASRDHLTVVADQIGAPTPARDIAKTLLAICEAMRQGAEGGTHHYCGAPNTSWAGFARETFRLAQMNVAVEDIPASAYPTPAARPYNSRLDCSALHSTFGIKPADWHAALATTIKELGASQ